MSDLKTLERELAQRQDDLNTCNEMLAMEPDYADALESKPILEADIADIRAQIAALRSKQDAPPPPPPADDAPPPPPKYDMSKHPKFHNTASDAPPPPADDAPTVFNVKDVVQAKFSEDKHWYEATITSKTGSNADPVYKVVFKGYGNTETKRKFEVRPLENPKKRKAEGPPAASTPTAPASPKAAVAAPNAPTHSAVISAAPAIDTTNKPVKREPSKVSDGPTRMPPEPKKLKGSKTLDKAKSSWQSWQASGPKKGAASAGGAMKKMNKESQFRTPDLPGAKVGFTGSGRPMQKDQARSKWEYLNRADWAYEEEQQQQQQQKKR